MDRHRAHQHEISVANHTADLYGYLDAMAPAEYLRDRVADTVRDDLKEELGFVAVSDRAFAREIVDVPDRRASLLVRLCLQNNGRLARIPWETLSGLADARVTAMKRTIRDAAAADRDERDRAGVADAGTADDAAETEGRLR